MKRERKRMREKEGEGHREIKSRLSRITAQRKCVKSANRNRPKDHKQSVRKFYPYVPYLASALPTIPRKERKGSARFLKGLNAPTSPIGGVKRLRRWHCSTRWLRSLPYVFRNRSCFKGKVWHPMMHRADDGRKIPPPPPSLLGAEQVILMREFVVRR